MDELLDADLASVARRLRARAVSPVELVEAALARIRKLEPQLRSFITVTDEAALAAARAAEREIAAGGYRGPLHGVPLGLKDVIATAGLRTTNGSRIFARAAPAEDAAVVRRLKSAGAIVIGKNNLHEFAMGSTTANPYYGACRNPWNLAHVPGGSSGGSAAAVAAGLCFGALATDTAGSVRSPASQCGVVGLKPTAEVVSAEGVFPVSPTLDHVGAMARRADDVGLILDAIATFPRQSGEPHRVEAGKLRIGVPTSYFYEGINSEVEEALGKALAKLAELGATMHPVVWPAARETAESALAIAAYESARTHAAWLAERPQDYSPELRERLQAAARVPRADYDRALAGVARLRREFLAAMEGVDVLAAPTNPVPAPKHGEQTVRLGAEELPIASVMPRFGAPANLLGCPAASVPCGFSRDGLPVGLQLIGRPFCDKMLLSVAAMYEGACPWQSLRPPLIDGTGEDDDKARRRTVT